TAFQGNTKIDVVRSTDQGQTWQIVSPKAPGGRNAQAVSLDPYLYVDHRTNRVFTIDNTVACLYMSYSDDEGGSWVTNPAMCSHPDVNDHQTIAAGPPATTPKAAMVAYPDVLYYCYNDVITTSCAKSLDGGVSWTQTGSPAFPGYNPNSLDYETEHVPG
ncbi:MAG: glycoside hydrolase, partial [Actinomycetota bacterium]|nr:glycoside hydrolase [Actinomycetota bacterium]